MRTVARHWSARRLAAIALGLSLFSMSGSVMARSTIRQPGEHLLYQLELEPHLLWGPYDPPGPPTGSGLGLGLRATIPILQNGFVSTINNSVGISFGIDWLHYWGDDELTIGSCSRWVIGPGGTNICTEVAGKLGGPSNYLMFPSAMQWNFWLTDQFSVFGEPGLTFYWEKGRYQSSSKFGATPLLQVGGRWHFMRRSTLTLRIGYPNISLGVSLFF